MIDGSTHDRRVWEFAKANGLLIVSKDGDFQRMSFVWGPPPKVVWLRVGNCPSSLIERVLRDSLSAIEQFCADPDGALLVLDD